MQYSWYKILLNYVVFFTPEAMNFKICLPVTLLFAVQISLTCKTDCPAIFITSLAHAQHTFTVLLTASADSRIYTSPTLPCSSLHRLTPSCKWERLLGIQHLLCGLLLFAFRLKTFLNTKRGLGSKDEFNTDILAHHDIILCISSLSTHNYDTYLFSSILFPNFIALSSSISIFNIIVRLYIHYPSQFSFIPMSCFIHCVVCYVVNCLLCFMVSPSQCPLCLYFFFQQWKEKKKRKWFIKL